MTFHASLVYILLALVGIAAQTAHAQSVAIYAAVGFACFAAARLSAANAQRIVSRDLRFIAWAFTCLTGCLSMLLMAVLIVAGVSSPIP